MDFKLPFLSLKSLSSLRICVQWADHQLGPFQDFSTTVDNAEWYKNAGLREGRARWIIDSLQIPSSLKTDLGEVLYGILEQLGVWWEYPKRDRDMRLLREVQFFHFDAFGRFDEKRTFKPVIQKTIAQENDLFSLHQLLTDAYDYWLLPEVDAILRKMVAIASTGRRSDILMEGPRHELRHGKYHLVYRLVQKDAADSLGSIRYPKRAGRVRIVLKRKSIDVAPCPITRHWNIDAFKDHFDLLEPSEREAFIEDVLGDKNGFRMGMTNQLDAFAFLKQKNCQRNWVMGIENGHFDLYLRRMLIWPFTSFFSGALKHWAPILKFLDYRIIFWVIVQVAMPDVLKCGVLHIDLLVYIWSVFTADEKRRCATCDLNFYWAVDKLEVKAPFLHHKIKTEIETASGEVFVPSNCARVDIVWDC